MKYFYLIHVFLFFIVLISCVPAGVKENENSNDEGPVGVNPSLVGFIIDHNCTDISKIPDQWITRVKQLLRVHYAHTSHGEQIVVGLQRLSSSNTRENLGIESQNRYGFFHEYCQVPTGQNGLKMMDGQPTSYCETYITPDLYWESDSGMNMTRSVLNNFDVNVSIWAWCTQLDYYSQSEVQNYLDKMVRLEAEFPAVTFVYMTGNAQSSDRNRYDRNQQIREFCMSNNKYLFDFADLDCWYNNQQHSENGVPMEHPHYNGDEAGHATYASCDNKAKAFWWLMARIVGWDGN